MVPMDDFEKNLRDCEDRRKLDKLADSTVRADQKAVEDYLRANSRAEFAKIAAALPGLVERANDIIGNDPHKYTVGVSPTAVMRGIVSAELLFHQAFQNYGDVRVSLAVGARPGTPLHVQVPVDRPFEFFPVLAEAGQIKWRAKGQGDFSSEKLAEFIVMQVSDYYDEMVRRIQKP